MKTISILGCTGSIGQNTLSVVESLPEQFQVEALAAGRDINRLADQVARFRPVLVSVAEPADVPALKELLRSKTVDPIPEIVCGAEGLVAVASCPGVEIVVSCTVGAVGFLPTYKALRLGRRVCLANKETLVMAGELMTRAASESGSELLPVDSEHNALHQCLRGEKNHEVERLILTASGGPFRLASLEQMQAATVSQALAHPTWQMGSKITIDSATLMNKGLEVIESQWFFHIPYERIDVVVHPESIIHSMVEFVDGSIKMQASLPNMHLPIMNALSYPGRLNVT